MAKDAGKRGRFAWIDPDQVSVNADSAWAESERRRSRRRTIVVYLCAVMLGIVGLMGASIVFLNATEPQQTSSASDSNTPGRASAMAAMRGWLEAPPIPALSLLAWNAVSVEELPDKDGVATGTVEEHTFTLEAAGKLYSSIVTVQVSPAGSPSLVGAPSLTPLLNDASDGSGLQTASWPGYVSTSASDSVDAGVEAWASAYLGGDGEALRREVGDPSSDVTYLPLSGLYVTSIQVVAVALPEDAKGVDESTVIARVMLTVANEPAPEEGETDEREQSQMSFDVLIHDADTASSRVVAWGGTGTGPGLARYGNAVHAVIASEPAEMSSPTSTPSDGK